jgi:uncharacterized repeat protein (TIGR01451 family)
VGANVLCDAGDLAPGNGAQFLIVVAPTNTASLTNSVQVITFSTDTNTVRKTASFVITNVAWPAPILVNAGAELLWEELSPPDGVVDPGEQVTVALKLENRGQIPTTTNLWATLLATDDVTLPGPSQRCGALSPFGPAAALAFTFTATQFPTNPFPTNIVAVLQLVDSSMGFTNYVPFSLNTPVSGNPASAQVIKIPDHGTAAPYPSALTVSGLSRLVKNVTVTVSNLTHGFPSDVNILVVSPSGQTVQLLGGAGAGYAVTNVALTFDDNAPAPAPKNSQLATTSYQPGSYSFVPFPFPGPVQPYGQKLAAFNGTDPNGPWRLYVFDSSPGDAGTIGGWSLNLTTVTPFTLAAANLRVTATNEPAPAVAGMPFSYSVTVLNGGPDQADNVLLTNTLPGNSRFVSANPSQGTCTNSGTELICSLGSLAANAVATVNVVVTPLASPSLTFGAAVGSPATDLYLTDNQVTLVTAVIIPLNPVLSGSYDGASQTFLLTLTGDAFTSYALQSSTDLVHWGFLTSGTTDASGWLQVADSRAAPQGHQFYRAVRQ